ncbi:hypothetical protein ColTof4_03527 [Colletotrichum tofieldiae]|nr:hypothetical protein ColTof3_13045 [Colletotrichum tofieldiae]GKT71104.1 hypothetical protein ColTof4_03527 [Colletotrichum tofieldiae]GKT93980.1 hypothetical protein Ct61P_11830 [Colletotrichum tofieldiae]
MRTRYNEPDSYTLLTAYFFLPPPRAAAKTIEQTVEAQGAEKTVDDLAEAQAVEKTANKVEDTGQEQTDGSKNLEERLSEETPQRVQLLLGVRHVLDLALGALDSLGDGTSQLHQGGIVDYHSSQTYLLQTLSEVVLLGRGLTSLRLRFGVLLDASIRVQCAHTAVQLGQDLATLLDKRLDILHELLLVTLLLGLALGSLNLLRNHLADGAQTVETLLNETTKVSSQLAVSLSLLASLLFLFGLSRSFLHLRNVLEQGDVSDDTVLGVNDVVVAVNLLAGADGHLAGSKLADDVSIFVDNLTLAVDTATFHRTLLLGEILEQGNMSDNAVFGVDDIVVLVDLLAGANAELTARKLAQGLAGLTNNLALLVDSLALHGTLRLGDILEKFDVSDNASLGVNDVVVLVDDLASARLNLARGQFPDDIAIFVDNFTAAVDLATLHRTLLPLRSSLGLPTLGLTKKVAVAVKDVTVLRLGVTLDKAAYDVSRGSNNGTVLGDSTARKLCEWTLLGAFAIALRNELSAADDVAGFAADVTLLVTHASNQLLNITLDNATVDGAVLVDNIAGLVDTLAGEGRVVNDDRRLGFGLRLRLRLPTLGSADGITTLVENVTLVINLFALKLLRVTFDDASNDFAVKEDMTV